MYDRLYAWYDGCHEWLRTRYPGWFRPMTIGTRGENAAARYLARKGYKIIGRGERGNIGEMDLVAVDGRTIVFIEVKTRRSHAKGHPSEAVDEEKQRRLTRIGLAYLKRHDLLEYPARFDVVAVTWPDDKQAPVIEHYANAFEPQGEGQLFA